MKSVMVFGTFDLLHPGHLFVLQEAGRRGSVTVVVARSTNVLRLKGAPPRQTDDERVAALCAAFSTYRIVLGDAEDFLVPVRTHAPDIILLGYDQELPPRITEADLAPAIIERMPAHRPDLFKTTLLKRRRH